MWQYLRGGPRKAGVSLPNHYHFYFGYKALQKDPNNLSVIYDGGSASLTFV